jgi:hypothetical protein
MSVDVDVKAGSGKTTMRKKRIKSVILEKLEIEKHKNIIATKG